MSKKDICIFTLSKNESYFLPKWIKYYGQFFDKNDMYVLDDNSTDGSTNNISANVIKIVTDPTTICGARCGYVIREHFYEFAKSYNYVFYVDVDEFVLPTPSPNLMDHLIKHMIANKNCFIATGYELMHFVEKESVEPFDTNKNILAQRSYGFFYKEYSKPVCANYPLKYVDGQHTADNEQHYSDTQRSDPELILVHAKRFDVHHTLQRHIHAYKNYDSTTHASGAVKWIIDKNYETFVNYHFNDPLQQSMLIPLRSLFYYDINTVF